jgi:hypothetical protein
MALVVGSIFFKVINLFQTEISFLLTMTDIVQVFINLVYLFGLAVVPARVYQEVCSFSTNLFFAQSIVCLNVCLVNMSVQLHIIEKLVSRNAAIWSSEDQKVDRLAKALMMTAHQSEAGITLGGYVIITKALTLQVRETAFYCKGTERNLRTIFIPKT